MAIKKKPTKAILPKKNPKSPAQKKLAVKAGPQESIRYTYFAACGNYPVTSRSAPLSVFWSNNEFGQQLWKEIDHSGRQYANLGPENKGWIPFEEMIAFLNDILGVTDFRKAYKNWTYKWEIGTAKYVNGRYEDYIDSKGIKRSRYKSDLMTEVKEIKTDTKGNPPTTGFTKEEREEYRRSQESRE